MRGLGVVYRKELKDAARDRRAALSGLLAFPIAMPLLIAGMLFLTLKTRVDDATATLSVPVVGGAAAPQLKAQLAMAGLMPDHDAHGDRAGLLAAVRAGEVEVGLVVAQDFGEALASGAPARAWLVFDSSRPLSGSQVGRLRDAIERYGDLLGAGRLRLRGVDPAAAHPITALAQDVSTPRSRSIILLGTMSYLLLVATAFGGAQMAMDATVGERERGSLEPLLAMPVAPAALVAGKLLAAATFMAIAAGVCAMSVALAAQQLPLARVGMAAGLGPVAALGLWLVVAPYALLAAAATTLATSFAKTLKEAWTYNSVAVLAPTLPILILLFKPMEPSLPAMFVPSLSQHLLATELIRGEAVVASHVLASAVATAAAAVPLAWLAALRYGRGRLLA